MNDRFAKFAILVVVLIVRRLPRAALLRPVAVLRLDPARRSRRAAPCPSSSASSIELFERASPSVVQVVGARRRASSARPRARTAPAASPAPASSGTAPATSSPTITSSQGAGRLAVRFASGQVLRAQVVGTAPNYDLAVLRVDNTRSLPPPIAIGTSADLKVGQ